MLLQLTAVHNSHHGKVFDKKAQYLELKNTSIDTKDRGIRNLEPYNQVIQYLAVMVLVL